tara:strand:- start:315 stop:452 length:138 start_codon:yes stop_codon:yes gene_type:complete
MNKTVQIRKPIQADDYGRIIPKPEKNKDKPKLNTDGRKVLALWSS